MNCKLRRLVRPSQDAYWWWLPECYAKDGKGHDPRYWSVVRCDAHTDKVGQFVGPLEAPVWPNAELSGGEAVRSDSLLAEAFTAIRALVQELSCYTSVNGADEDDEQALAFGRDVLSKANAESDSR